MKLNSALCAKVVIAFYLIATSFASFGQIMSKASITLKENVDWKVGQ